MIDIRQIYDDLFYYLAHSRFRHWADQVQALTAEKLIEKSHGDLHRWLAALDRLPDIPDACVIMDQPVITIESPNPLDEAHQSTIHEALKGLSPWRKGPFRFFGTYIDTEWHSDWKWDRVAPHLPSLEGQVVLDVGCGSGYHCWRMRGAGAKRVIGIDPSQLFLMQFLAVKKYAGWREPVDYLPFKMEEIQTNLNAFDTVFSMGVLYHRRSPIDHLYELKGALKPGGQLVLETLVVDPPVPEIRLGYTLMPQDRYAMMRNVWFIPTTDTLALWLERTGFHHVRCVDVSQTTVEEQRATEWMTYQSLPDFLDPRDPDKTIEGYPAPVRAVMVAEKPA